MVPTMILNMVPFFIDSKGLTMVPLFKESMVFIIVKFFIVYFPMGLFFIDDNICSVSHYSLIVHRPNGSYNVAISYSVINS